MVTNIQITKDLRSPEHVDANNRGPSHIVTFGTFTGGETQAAAARQPPAAIVRLLTSAMHASTHAVKLLARVTHAANHHKAEVAGDNGRLVSRILRDSVDAPRRRRAAHAPEAQHRSILLKAAPKPVRPWNGPLGGSSRRVGSRSSRVAKLEQENVHRRVAEIGRTLGSHSSQPSATERLTALRSRVRARAQSG